MPHVNTGSPGAFSRAVVLRLLTIFLPSALLTGGVVLALYRHDLGKEQTLYEQAGTHLVDLQAEIINREFKTVESDLFILANQAVLKDFLSEWPKGKERLEKEYRLFCQQRRVYDQIRYLDKTGQERVRINYLGGKASIVPAAELQPKAERYYFSGTMRLGHKGIFVSPLDLNVEHEKIEEPHKPVIRFATPVFDQRDDKQGILILNYLGAALIRKLTEVSSAFPGSALLVNPAGFFLRGPSPDDEWGFMFNRNRTFASYYPEEWPRLARSGAGQFRTEHGLFTFRTLWPPEFPDQAPNPVPAGDGADPVAADPGLIIVSHIPTAVLGGQSAQLLGRLLVLAGVVLLLLFGSAWYLAYAGALRRNQEQQMADSEARLRTLSTQLITAQEDERRKLSRDLHDELGQLVTAVTLDLQRVSQTGNQEKKNELIGRALHGTGLLLNSIHEISARVRPTILDDLGLKDAVQNLLSDYERRTGIVPQSELRFERDDVGAQVSENVYRILQEALTNVSKHARAQEVFVELRAADGQVFLAVRDKGVGFAPEALAGRGLGILGMRERAELLNGTFVVKAAPGKGSEIQVTIPIPKLTAK